MKIRGNTVGTTMKRPDWNQTNERASDFIRNKPMTIPAVTTRHNDMHLKVVDGAWTPVYECADGSSYMFVTDTERAYKKTVPNQAMGKAMIDKIGGGPAYIAPSTNRASLINFASFGSGVVAYPGESRVALENPPYSEINFSLHKPLAPLEEYSIHVLYKPTNRSILREVIIGGTLYLTGLSSWEENQTYKKTMKPYVDSPEVCLYFRDENGRAIIPQGDLWIQVFKGNEVPEFCEYLPKVNCVMAYKKNYIGPTYPMLKEKKTQNGLTFTPMPNGDIILNGTAERNISVYLYEEGGNEPLYLEEGTYCISCSGHDGVTLYLMPNSSKRFKSDCEIAESDEFHNIGYRLYLYVLSGTSFDNCVLHPWIVKGSDYHIVSSYILYDCAFDNLDGYGEEGNYIDLERRVFVNTKTGEEVAIEADLINELPDVEPGGTIVFGNVHERPVDSEVTYQIKV